MSIINPQTKEIHCKIVYYGPALAGKTTSMMALQNLITSKKRPAKDIAVKDRTLFFDFLALSAKEKIKSYKVKFQAYTVPGQVLYEDSRKLLLNGVDGIVFVADSRLEYLEDSLKSRQELEVNLAKLGYVPGEIPLVIQYNKRDAATAARLEDLRDVLNPDGVPDFETIAHKGEGVTAGFEKILELVMLDLKKSH